MTITAAKSEFPQGLLTRPIATIPFARSMLTDCRCAIEVGGNDATWSRPCADASVLFFGTIGALAFSTHILAVRDSTASTSVTISSAIFMRFDDGSLSRTLAALAMKR